ncbi:hypothetical protein A1O7_02770 [Cladophialophora yegresii CBS 114405]|uniref:Uncharacterized protein n=1 Tax=Cladophialophora yegresii CBS 114405 TaxID=1182544 RepID=W9WCS6_9EURO|nr:uncharacterized protein A1O7_02770 [Cladophialophora yegresii CBS 114405]EXJ62336.1 hypothetical protein A1O7_02770 [Cladophialophora yegresii CBS 114405]
MATFIASVCHPLGRDSDFDTPTAAFVSTIEQATDLSEKAKLHTSVSQRESRLTTSTTAATKRNKKTFTVDMGFIPVLYFTALKCRVPRIRRQAIKLMQVSPRREGVCDGEFTAAIAGRVVEIEEGGYFAGFDVEREFDTFDIAVVGW